MRSVARVGGLFAGYLFVRLLERVVLSMEAPPGWNAGPVPA